VSGWSPERSVHLGASTLSSVADCLGLLRGEIDVPARDGGDEGDEGDDE